MTTPKPPERIFSDISTERIQDFLDPDATASPFSPHEKARAVARLAERAARSILDRADDYVGAFERDQGFNPTEARRAIAGALEPIHADALIDLWSQEIEPFLENSRHQPMPGLTTVFAGGCIPQPSVQALVAAAMISGKVLFRPSRTDPFLAPLLIEEIARSNDSDSVLPDPHEWILCGSWPHEDEELTRSAVGKADAFVVFGEHQTIEPLLKFLSPGASKFIYGPRISFACLDLEARASDEEMEREAANLADDIAAFDQRGCLSPATVYLKTPDAARADAWVHILADALEKRGRGQGFTRRLPPSAAYQIRSLRDVYAMDPSGDRSVVHGASLPGWTLLIDRKDSSLRPSPGYQTLRVARVESWEALVEAVRPMAGKLQAMGLGPTGASYPETVAAELKLMGLSRSCSLGRMQAPPLEWTHDGNPFFPFRPDIGGNGVRDGDKMKPRKSHGSGVWPRGKV